MKVIAGLLLCLMFVGCTEYSKEPVFHSKKIGKLQVGGWTNDVYEVEIDGNKYLTVLSDHGNLTLKPEKVKQQEKPVLLAIMKGMPVYIMDVDGVAYYMTPIKDQQPTVVPFDPFNAAPKAESEDKEG